MRVRVGSIYRYDPVTAVAGEIYGRLTVLGMSPSVGADQRCICQCACGQIKSIRLGGLRCKTKRGSNPGCGCATGGKPKPLGVAAFNKLYHWYSNKKSARKSRFLLDKETFTLLVKSDCHYCGKPPSRAIRLKSGTIEYNGIDRVASEWDYTATNCVPACFECNRMKMAVPYPIFLKHIARIYKHMGLAKCA